MIKDKSAKRLMDSMYREGFSHIHGTLKEQGSDYRAIADNSGDTVNGYLLTLPYEVRFLVSKMYMEHPEGFESDEITLSVDKSSKEFEIVYPEMEKHRKEFIEKETTDNEQRIIDRLTAESVITIDNVDSDIPVYDNDAPELPYTDDEEE